MLDWKTVLVNGVRVARRICFLTIDGAPRVLVGVPELSVAFEASYRSSKSRR